MTTTYLALFRGINVGGKNMMPMKSLIDIFTRAGCENVRTFIQSGNVYFEAEKKLIDSLPELVAAQTTKKFKYSIPITVRSAAQLAKVVAGNPFADATEADNLHVLFLAAKPAPAAVESLDPNRSPGDKYTVKGQEIYACFGNGMGNTKLTSAYFDSKLKTICTARNWRTTTKLLELMKA